MVRTWKRLAAALLATAMLASTLSVSAFAADAPAVDAAQSQIVEPVKTIGEGDETPGEGDETPGEGDETPGEGDETPGEGDETPGEGDGFVLPEGFTEADLALLEADPTTLSLVDQMKQQELSAALNAAMGISMMSFRAPEYTVSTAQDLKDFAAAVNGGNTFSGITVKLAADIDLSTVCSATAGSWTPIGTDDNYRFEGTFDGQNHTVSNLYINSADAFNVGLFGYCCGTVKNLGVVNASVNTSRDGNVWVGIIAGKLNSFTADGNSSNDTAHLKNCFATGTVTVTATSSKYVGGLVGYAVQSTISNCYSTAAVTVTATTGQGNVGGVVGLLEDATLDTCYCTGAVSGSTVLGSTTGGVVAWARKAYVKSSVTNCVALNPSVFGAANSTSQVQTGAVVGYCFNANNATLTGNAYWDGMTIKKNGTTVTDKDQSSSTVLTYNATEAKLKAGSSDFVWSNFSADTWENKTAGTVPTLKTIPGQSSLLPAHIKPRVTVTVTDLDLTSLLAAPVKNSTPQTTVTDTQYTGTVTWTPNNAAFAGSTIYVATVTLTAAEGYKLEGLAARAFTYTGATSVYNDANSGIVTIVFPATPARTLTGIAVKTAPTKKDYTYGDAFAPAGLVLDLTYDDGTDTVTYTDANAGDFTISSMSAGTTAVTVTYGGQSASISGITVAKKALTWDVSGLSAIKPYDGTTTAKVTGALKVSGVVGEDDAQFGYASLSGTYGVRDSGSNRMVTVTVTTPALGNDNYSLPTTNPTFLGTIARPVPVPSIDDRSTTLKLTATDIQVPAALKTNDALNTPEKITAAMKQKATQLLPGVPDEQIFTVDITLWQKDTGDDWTEAEQVASYPQGVTITQRYEAFGLTADTAKGVDFVIAHMVSSGESAGTIETLPYTLTAEGLQFTMYSFSPVTIAFRAKSVAPAPAATPAPAPAAAPGNYTVNAWVNVLAGGVVSPMGITTYAEGENVTYTITPAAGYRVAKVLVDGVDVGAVASYTFSGLNRSHEIGVYFDKGASTAQTIAAPKTGDNAPIALWSVLLLSAILGLGSMEQKRRKKNL